MLRQDKTRACAPTFLPAPRAAAPRWLVLAGPVLAGARVAARDGVADRGRGRLAAAERARGCGRLDAHANGTGGVSPQPTH
eukprot:COSAG06_NODE_3717_length_4978_cov_1.916991_6_plen_81_part_00